jgi:hypothetical protein
LDPSLRIVHKGRCHLFPTASFFFDPIEWE